MLKWEIPVLVVFYSQSESQSKKIYLMTAQQSTSYADKIKFAFMDMGNVLGTHPPYSVYNVPTCIIFRDGKIVSRKAGLMDAKELYDWLWSYCR